MAIRNWKDIPLFKDVTEEQWNDWHWQVANRLNTVEQIKQVVNLTPQEEEDITKVIFQPKQHSLYLIMRKETKTKMRGGG